MKQVIRALLLFALFLHIKGKFHEAPVVLVTSDHLRTGKEYDTALIWTEDVTKDSFKVCLRELQNFDGKHEDINVVCTLTYRLLNVCRKVNETFW